VSDVSPYEILSNGESKLLHVDMRSDIGQQLSARTFENVLDVTRDRHLNWSNNKERQTRKAC
jgi:hypothetical protein